MFGTSLPFRWLTLLGVALAVGAGLPLHQAEHKACCATHADRHESDGDPEQSEGDCPICHVACGLATVGLDAGPVSFVDGPVERTAGRNDRLTACRPILAFDGRGPPARA